MAVSIVEIPQAGEKLSVTIFEVTARCLETFRVDFHPVTWYAFIHLQEDIAVAIYEDSMWSELMNAFRYLHFFWNRKAVNTLDSKVRVIPGIFGALSQDFPACLQ